MNPILAGDHAGPSILKDGDDYYLVCSSFYRYPGLLIWHSKDLVNWEPITAALQQTVGLGASDGLSVRGEMEKFYDGWQYPEDDAARRNLRTINIRRFQTFNYRYFAVKEIAKPRAF